jgi:catechol 2,3-dioxygenase-like lactoylglutathione lyase family enzyme
MKALRIAAIRLDCQDVAAEAEFFRSALGFQPQAGSPFLLKLGRQCVELVDASTTPTLRVPADSTAFQHFAIVVSDMAAAIAALDRHAGWSAISRAGPQRLPASAGGVVAFKFRDPEGHPLELLQFPPDATPAAWRRSGGPFLGIDHSAIVVDDTARSVAFYQELGFAVSHQQLNQGIEQGRLDDVSNAVVEVSSLTLQAKEPPHLELLCYRPRSQAVRQAPSGPAAIQLVLDVASSAPARSNGGELEKDISDPDGHRLAVRERPGE